MKDDFTVLIQNRTEFEKGNPATVFLSLPATKEELHEAMKALNGICTLPLSLRK